MFNFAKIFYRCSRNNNQLFFSKHLHPLIPSASFSNITASIDGFNAIVSSKNPKQWDKFAKDKIRKAYNLSSQEDIKSIVEKYKKYRTKLSLNEEIVFLDTLANAVALSNTQFNFVQNPSIDSLLTKVKTKLRNSEEDYPLVGSLLYSMGSLKFYKDPELWLISTDYIIDQRMNASFDELVQAFKGSLDLQKLTDENLSENFFVSLEELITREYAKTIFPLKDLEKVCQDYAKTSRMNFDFIEVLHQSFTEHLLNELSSAGENSASANFHHLIKIGYYFAKWGFINSESLSHFQNLVESQIIKQELNQDVSQQFHPESFSYMTYNLGLASMTSNVTINLRILQFMNDYLLTTENRGFQLQHLEHLHNYLPELGITEPEILQKLRQDVFDIDHSRTGLYDIQNYIETRVSKELENDFQLFPKDALYHFDKICSTRINDYKPADLYDFFVFIENSDIRHNFKELWQHLPDYIIRNIAAFDFEMMCYLYYIYVKHGGLNTTGKFKENLEILKDYILLYYRSIPRGKLEITSNFYKVLEVVDINKFYEKGEY